MVRGREGANLNFQTISVIFFIILFLTVPIKLFRNTAGGGGG